MSMHDAIDDNDVAALKTLILSGADVDCADEYGRSVLQYAARNGRVECVKVLLEAKADVDKADEYRRRPLLFALKADHVDCVQVSVGGMLFVLLHSRWLV